MPATGNGNKRETRDMWLRIGGALLDKMTAASVANNRDRSAWAEGVLTAAVRKGLPKQLNTKLMISALQRDARVLLRVRANLVDKITARATKLGLTLTDFVIFTMIGELERRA